MMTIKEFAALCGCNAQTLRYYDKIDLLKPVKVDQWSGYRYYNAQQALDFVKIKNLQAADFTIEEIKLLLTKSDHEVYEAFTAKIDEQQQKLARILEIQKTYLKEKSTMENIINNLSDFLLEQFNNPEDLREFGLKSEDGPEIVRQIKAYLGHLIRNSVVDPREVTLIVDNEVFRGEDNVARVMFELDGEQLPETIILGSEDVTQENFYVPDEYETLWEISGWNHIHEFIDNIPPLEDGAFYTFRFRLNKESHRENLAFPLLMLGAMILKHGASPVNMGCDMERSDDEKNHFALLKRK